MSPAELYQCEQCDNYVTEEAAHIEKEPGYDETVILAFCPECTSE